MAGEGMRIFLCVDTVLAEVVTAKTAAYHLKYAYTTVHQWLNEGKLIGFNVDGRWFVPLSEIERIKIRDLSGCLEAS